MRVLFTTYEGGGHVPPALRVARVLRDRGHEVLFISDEATRPVAEREGLAFEPWRRAPNRTAAAQADDPVQDWRARTPWNVVRAVCDAVMCGPAAAYGADTLQTAERFRPDVIVSMELLFGVMAAAEKIATPLALLSGNLWCFPTREDVPPFGPGFIDSDASWARNRDAFTRRAIARWYDAGLPALNSARRGLNLPPLAATLEQLGAADAILLGAAQAFDWPEAPPPTPFQYVGPLIGVPDWVAGSTPLSRDERPLVLASMGTTYENQAPVMARIITALGGLPVRGIATLGPAIRLEDMPGPPNVEVVQSADHDALAPQCAAVVCHGGHGTVLRPLMHGVPTLCLPFGRDQPENAARIGGRGAGLRLPKSASIARIARAVSRLLAEPAFAKNARTLGAAVAAEVDGGQRAADAIERLAKHQPRAA